MYTETSQPGAPLHFCTVVSKNYIAQARALAETVREHHPDSPFHVLLVDRPDGRFDPDAEPFPVVGIEDLPVPDLPRFCFQYNVLELNTAAKPFFLAHLLKTTRSRKLVYLDPDVAVLRRMDPLSRLLDEYNVVLTPHLTAPYPLDGKGLEERDILLAGAFNLGFIGLAAGAETDRMLRWWQERVYAGCRVQPDRGLFVDQKWMDLAPGYFDGVHVLCEPGYNIAYWNLHSRPITLREGRVWADGRPAYFFHFSGYDPAEPTAVSKFQNRLTMADVGEASLLFADYAERLRRHGHARAVRWPYAFAAFDNGVRIDEGWRRLYLELGDAALAFGDPFRTAGEWSFYRCLLGRAAGRAAPGPDIQIRKAGRKASGRFGVNLAGYIRSEKGVGEAARAVLRTLDAAGVPYVLTDVCDPGAKNADLSYARFADANPYAVSVVQVNADQAPLFFKDRPDFCAGKLAVGYWNWELSEFPEEWTDGFRYFDEIWAPSRFTRDAIAAKSPVPVRCIPFSISVPPAPAPWIARDRFGLPGDVFLFLFAFDFHSFLERKNPAGLVRAFDRAFGARDDVGLVLKTMHADDADRECALLRRLCRGRRNIHLLNEVYSRRETLALMHLCDAYASLHRCEGFGLTIAEAMAMGKPVVATAYSANLDFMTESNSRPVRCRLIEIDRDHGPYRKGMAWADPDLDHAAEEMRRLVEDPALARRLGGRAREDVARQLSPAAVGAEILAALTDAAARPSEAALAV